MKKEYLNEENYQKTKSKISKLSLVILLVGILIGSTLIGVGLYKNYMVNLEYSEENIQKQIDEKTILLEEEKNKLNKQKEELEKKVSPVQEEIKSLSRVQFDGFNDAYYERQDRIEELKESIKYDEEALADIENYNNTGLCYNDKVLENVCNLQSEIAMLEMSDNSFNKTRQKSGNIVFFMFGSFIIVASCMFSFAVYMISKRREIAAFSVQQMMPIAQEGIEKMAPSIGKAGKSIMKEMAPMYGEMAKEISKGIKDGLKDEKSDKDNEEK